MEYKEKNKEQLVTEIEELNRQIIELERVEFEHKQTEEKLKESETQLRTVLETIEDGITFSDGSGHFYIYNSAMEKLTGYSMEEANAVSDFTQLLYPDPRDRQLAFEGILELLAKGKSREAEVSIVTKSGQLKHILVSSSLVPYQDRRMFLSAYRDITARKKAEQELKEAYEKLKRTETQLIQTAKMATVGQLASGVAHEINNPLTGVLNNVQLIKMMAEQKKDFTLNDFKELLNIVEESALRCKKITQSLLAFSRASEGILNPVSLNDLVEKVTTIIQHEMELENILIHKQLEPNLPQIMGDSQLLQQLIFDIISNARWAIYKKSGKEGGTITIKTQYEPENKRVCLYISDTGIGIPVENLSHMFEPFFTTKAVGEGTGLGLSIAYNIIRQHKGNIEVETEVNKGTTFKISLPSL